MIRGIKEVGQRDLLAHLFVRSLSTSPSHKLTDLLTEGHKPEMFPVPAVLRQKLIYKTEKPLFKLLADQSQKYNIK